MATANQEWYAHIVERGLAQVDLSTGLSLMERTRQEGRDGERQDSRRFWDKVLAEMRSGVQPTIDADEMERLLRLARRA